MIGSVWLAPSMGKSRVWARSVVCSCSSTRLFSGMKPPFSLMDVPASFPWSSGMLAWASGDLLSGPLGEETLLGLLCTTGELWSKTGASGISAPLTLDLEAGPVVRRAPGGLLYEPPLSCS